MAERERGGPWGILPDPRGPSLGVSASSDLACSLLPHPQHNTNKTTCDGKDTKSSKTTKHGRTSKTEKSQRRRKKTGVAGKSSGVAGKLLGSHQGLPGIAGGSRAPGWALTAPQSGTGHGHHGTPPPRHGSHPAPSLHRPIYLHLHRPIHQPSNLLISDLPTFVFLTF